MYCRKKLISHYIEKKNQSSAFLNLQGCNSEQLCCIDLRRSSIEHNDPTTSDLLPW